MDKIPDLSREQGGGKGDLTIDGCQPDQGRSGPVDQARLAARLRSGDRAAAEELVDLYYRRIYLYVRQLGHSRQTSEDLTQEVFMRAWYHIDQLRDDKALACWLFRIAHNVSYQHRRWLGRMEGHLSVANQQGRGPSGQSAYEPAEIKDTVAKVRDVVAAMPWKIRQAIVLHYMQDLSISDAAQVMGVRQGTFKSRLHRGLEILRRQLNGLGLDQPDKLRQG